MRQTDTSVAERARVHRARRWRTPAAIRARQIGIAVAGAALLTVSTQSPATPLSLAQSPLFLSGTVQPNILFVVDDSGSMDWNMVTKESEGKMYLTAGGNTVSYTYLFPQVDNAYAATDGNGRILPTEAAVLAFGSKMPANAFGVWRGRYSGYNTLYYNPEVRYLPWEGVDADGVAFTNATPTAARLNPYSTAGGTNVIDLTALMSWSADRVPNNDGEVMSGNARNSGNTATTIGIDASASNTAGYYNGMTITITAGIGVGQDPRLITGYTGSTTTPVATVTPAWITTPDTTSDYSFGLPVTNFYPAMYYTWTDTDSDGVVDAGDGHTPVEIKPATPTYARTTGNRSDCANPLLCTYAEEIVNFANWFQYYRRRILTSKSAIGAVIAPSSARMGLATLHNNGTVNTQISPMNPSATSGNKKTLLDAVYKNSAQSGTPLRTALDKAGKYYQCVDGNSFDPALNDGAAGTTCPILSAADGGSCQKNFTVLTTDGYYNDTFTTDNHDGDNDTAFDGGAYRDTRSNTLADVAMNYYENDLSILANQVFPVPGVDVATHQHMATYTVAFGVDGTLTANPPNTTSSFAWPNPALGDAQKIDDLRHAAFNGRGKFLSAKSPLELRDSLGSALGHITGLLGSASSVAVNSHILSTTTVIYQARFTSGEWSGDLRALPVSPTGAIGAELWSSGALLKSQNWNTGRQIITHDGTAGVAFRWSDLSTAQQASLNIDPATGTADATPRGPDRLNWLRGDASKETTSPAFRRRLDSYGAHFKLGDLINSSPVYVGAPSFLPDNLPGDAAHLPFSTAYATRGHVIYVGGNDGMLHGFSAATGQEVLAYVPAKLFPDLSKLTDPAYTHRYYVDGSPVADNAYGTFLGCTTAPCWRTVLVSGLGAGGKGYFALDVTDPGTFASAETVNAGKIALWEFPATADPDVGYSFSQPTIAKVQTGASTYKWVAIFGNGYNSDNQSASLYVVDIENGAIVSQIEVDDGAGGTSGNGLSTPAVHDANGDYIADYVYAGDLRGNLWKFSLNTGDKTTWGASFGATGAPQPLFRAVDSTGVPQPITERPAIGKPGVVGGDALAAPLTTGTMVYVGTGRYVDIADRAPPANPDHTFYGIWDKGAASTTVPVTRNDLLAQSLSTLTITKTDGTTTTARDITDLPITYRQSGGTACAPDGTGECLGWRVELPASGEMSVANPVLLTTDNVDLPRIIFPTLVPGADACSAGGTSWLMELNPATGGLLTSPYIDTNGDGLINGSDQVPAGFDLGIGIVQEPVVIYDPAQGLVHKVFSGSTGAVSNAQQEGDTAAGGGGGGTPPAGVGTRKSWRQIK